MYEYKNMFYIDDDIFWRIRSIILLDYWIFLIWREKMRWNTNWEMKIIYNKISQPLREAVKSFNIRVDMAWTTSNPTRLIAINESPKIV
jgi:hypothetical protein